ncbi:MAG: rod shape-determining protein [Clostridium sp.]|nr:rod shape-determining protein [Clostridium sp.]MCM1398146.1 rod shape-determining protein [Clostridium sp.]MCM1460853.1 rod shape-determining protein [Bacteroides sp.]
MINIDIGIDLGSSNTVVYIKDKGIVVNQPSVIAYEVRSKKIVAVGNKAKKMLGKTPEEIEVVRPIRGGVISDYTLTERMVKLFVKNAMEKRKIWGRPNICVCVPSGITPVQVRAVEDAVYRTGAKNVYILEEPFAAAIGAGIEVNSPKGYMVVDIGGGTTDIAIISKGGIQIEKSIKAAGEDFDEAIIRYMRKRHNIQLGNVSAEALKLEIGSVYPRQKDAVGYAKGKELVRGLPIKLQVKSSEIIDAVSEIANQIVDGVKITLEQCLPELVADISEQGILLSGGGSKIYGMDKLIYDKIGVKAMHIESPELLVAKGAGTARRYVKLREN